MGEIDTLMHEMKSILYGNAESVPAAEACSQLTQEFFKNDTLRLIINCLPKLNLEVYIYTVEFFRILVTFAVIFLHSFMQSACWYALFIAFNFLRK